MKESYFDHHIPEDGHSYSKYIISKYAMHSENTVILRLFGIFGRYEDYLYKFISNTIAKSIENISYKIYQNCIYDYLYVDDFFGIVCKLLENNISYGQFNVTPSKSIALADICNIVNKVSGNNLPISIARSGFGNEYTGDNSKLLSAINGFEFTRPEDAITDLYSFYKTVQIDRNKLCEDSFLSYASKIQKK